MTAGRGTARWNVLVTGGSGFLGRRIVREVRKLGHEVRAPRRAELDLETGAGVREFFARAKADGTVIDCVVHSAAYYGGIGICQSDPLGLAVRNARMAATVFEESARASVRTIVSVGSTCAYPGGIEGADMTEDMIFAGRCHPSVEAYGHSKRLQLVMMAAAHRQHGIESVQLALTNLYGEHDVFQERRSHAIAALIKKIVDARLGGGTVTLWGTGDPVRQFLYVGDAAWAVAQATGLGHQALPVNVGGSVMSIRDLAHDIADLVGLPRESIRWDPGRPDGVARKVVDESRLRNLCPEYSPTPFREGLRRTVRWYMDNKEAADRRE